MRNRREALAAASLILVPGAAMAQRAPEGPVTIVVPYTPGTGHDILGRLLAPHLQRRFGQPVIVENRPGASGNLGAGAVARAAPDGRTLMIQGDAFVINPGLFRQLPFDTVTGFTPIATLTTAELVLVVNPSVPAESVAAFAALARARPGDLDYASPGIGTPQHMSMALFGLTTGTALNHVPYRGAAGAVQDVIGRRVASMFMPLHTALPLARAGQVRMLGLGGARRSPTAPEVPTLAEAGIAMSDVGLWYGLLGPAGMAADLVSSLNAEVNAWLALPTTLEALRIQGMSPAGGTPAAFGDLIATDLRRWAAVVRDARITAE